jgi:phospholipid/cholesterol/gamma-HCH transport system substrate-binding protein
MAHRTANNIKLGVFVLAGLLFLILLLYMIGRNRNLFGSTYTLKARFENVHGLVNGNNVRFSGIEAGSVKNVKILNDTVIEITMVIDKKMRNIIRKDAVASIGTDGLVGNKVVNIEPSRRPSDLAVSGDILPSKKAVDTDEMLQTLYHTNNDVAMIAFELKNTVQRLNNSDPLWSLLNDQSIPRSVKATVSKINATAENAKRITTGIHELLVDVSNGKGSLGTILRDSSIVINLNKAVSSIRKAADDADSIAIEIASVINGVNEDIKNGKGTAHALLRDSSLVRKLEESLANVEKGTAKFDQVMEALKHNFLFRGYFRKQGKQAREKEN